MKIALINENSQAAKNALAHEMLKQVVEPLGHTVYNYGMHGADDPYFLTYVQNGLLSAILLNSGAVDFVVTGCGSGQGALISSNAFPGVQCGLMVEPYDGYLFAHINDGNAVSFPFSKVEGDSGSKLLHETFRQLFCFGHGLGHPKERAEGQQRNKKILDELKTITHTDMFTILKNMDQELLKSTVSSDYFKEYFFDNCQDQAIADYIRSIL